MNFDPLIDLNIAHSILDLLPMGVCVLNGERRIQWVNERVVHRFETEKHYWSGEKHCYREIFKRTRPCPDCPAIKTLKSGRMEHGEVRSEHHGEERRYLVTATPLKKEQDEGKTLIIETIQDLTVQRKAETELRRLNDFNTAIIDNAPVAIFTVDKSGKFMSVNPALAALSGLGDQAEEKLLGFNWIENPYTVRCGLAEHIKRGLEGVSFELQDFPFTTYRGDRGQYIHFRGVPLMGKDGKVEGLLCIIEDNTEKVKALMQSIQDAKMSVIGGLMTGVAHELNNPLAAIAANSELASEMFQNIKDGSANKDDIEELRGYLEAIEEQAFRCKDIIKDMIDLTKKEGFEVHEINLPALLKEILGVLRLRKLKIRLVKEIPRRLPFVKGDINALKQCFLNILHNAADAVEGRDAAVIRIQARHEEDRIKVEIEDNGVGIHDGLVDKIFEPFFSTKDTGKGVGLGLTLCYEFLKRMGADISVKSTLGKGSCFMVTLPACEEKKKRGRRPK
jgi:PAS domain S-box-containing protein